MVVAFALAASAAQPDEEVIVYGDPWARWRATRWLVESDLVVPLGVTFAKDDNLAFTTHLFQLRAVLACDLEGEAAKKKAEVGCTIEDVALLPTTLRDWNSEAHRARVAEVLKQIDGRLTGMVVQLQVDSAGGVTNFDLEGIDADNARERANVESLREVVARMVSGFHLRVPEQYRGGGTWPEYHSALMDMGSLVGSRGSSTLVHRLSAVDGHPILETVGEGSAAINVPSYTQQLMRPAPAGSTPVVGPDGSSADAAQMALEAPSLPSFTPDSSLITGPSTPFGAIPGFQGWEAPPMYPPNPEATGPSQTNQNQLLIEATYSLAATGVGVFDDGTLSERVWVVTGTPTPSSPVQTPYLNRGRLLRLRPDQHPNLGPSAQVAYPGFAMEGLPAYPDLQ